jgi:hypothetical protein
VKRGFPLLNRFPKEFEEEGALLDRQALITPQQSHDFSGFFASHPMSVRHSVWLSRRRENAFGEPIDRKPPSYA